MSYYEVISQYDDEKLIEFLNTRTSKDVSEVLDKSSIDKWDFLTLISPAARNKMEEMAARAKELHFQNFGKSISIFTPLYISNYCINRCVYCDYNKESDIHRYQMSYEEIEREAKELSKTNLQNILVLTGEDHKNTNLEYLIEAIKILNKYYDNLSIEVYPTTEKGYKKLADAGVNGLSVYQETYNKRRYEEVHLSGPKSNYKWRLDAPERALKSGIRFATVGALLGLSNWRLDTFYTGEHVRYLNNKFTEAELGISVPRIKKSYDDELDITGVSDRDLVQAVLAHKIYQPHVSITLTTRESPHIRDGLLPICISKMSAGVSTKVGGHTLDIDGEPGQFEISDSRSVDEIKELIKSFGYQPVVRDWIRLWRSY